MCKLYIVEGLVTFWTKGGGVTYIPGKCRNFDLFLDLLMQNKTPRCALHVVFNWIDSRCVGRGGAWPLQELLGSMVHVEPCNTFLPV